jgi:hypothetical protein
VSYSEESEVRSLPAGDLFLTFLTAPADLFPVMHQAAQRLVSVDQQSPIRAAPVVSGA